LKQRRTPSDWARPAGGCRLSSVAFAALLACHSPDDVSDPRPDVGGAAGLNRGSEGIAGHEIGEEAGRPSGSGGNAGGGGAPATGGARNQAGSAGNGGDALALGGQSSVRDPSLPLTATCPEQAVLCESFEQDPLDTARWSITGMAGSVTIDATQSVDGKSSLHLQSGSERGLAPPFAASLLEHVPATNDRIYMRVYMRYGDLTLPGYHPNLITVTDGNYDVGHWPDFSIWSFGWFWNDFSINGFGRGLDGAKIWMEDGNEQQAGGFYLGDKTPSVEQWLQVDHWYCLEVMGFGDDLGDGNQDGDREEVRVWIDDMEISGLHANDAYWKGYGAKERWSPKYDGSLWSFGISGQAPQDGQKIDIWYDALAFSSERIGCAK
jgi:hypothetical protein